MKLRNLMYATMIACAFASCSKDDAEIVGPDGPDAQGDVTLEVQIFNPATKALPTTEAAEKVVNKLFLLVFNGDTDGAILEAKSVTRGKADNGATTGAQQSVKTNVKPGTKRVLVLANIDETKLSAQLTTGTTTLSDVLGTITYPFEAEKGNAGLSMNSKVYTISVTEGKNNYMGYGDASAVTSLDANGVAVPNATAKVELFRNVGKVVLSSIAFDTKVDAQYKDAKFTAKKVFLLHAHKNTRIAANLAWGAINVPGAYHNGVENSTYTNTWVKYMVDGSYQKIYNYIVGDLAQDASDVSTYSVGLSNMDIPNTNTPQAISNVTFYAYENTENPALTVAAGETLGYNTLLVIQGDFEYRKIGADGNYENALTKMSDRYYPIMIGANTTKNDITANGNPLDSRADVKGLLRNLQYNVTMKITGPGYNTPFGPKPDGGNTPDVPGDGGDTFLDAQVKVVDFGTVSQPGEVE